MKRHLAEWLSNNDYLVIYNVKDDVFIGASDAGTGQADWIVGLFAEYLEELDAQETSRIYAARDIREAQRGSQEEGHRHLNALAGDLGGAAERDGPADQEGQWLLQYRNSSSTCGT